MRATGVQQLRHPGFGNSARLHRLGQLPGDHFLDGLGLQLLKYAFVFEKFVERAADVVISFIRFIAKAMSPGDVFCVFLMNPCNATISPSCTQNNRRAIRLLSLARPCRRFFPAFHRRFREAGESVRGYQLQGDTFCTSFRCRNDKDRCDQFWECSLRKGVR